MRDRGLSHRQRQCLEARLQRKTAKEIGRQLNISHNTVNMHLRLAALKLRASRRPPRNRVGKRQYRCRADVASAGLIGSLPWLGQRSWSAAFSTTILVAALLSLAIAEQFSLSLDQPLYSAFG